MKYPYRTRLSDGIRGTVSSVHQRRRFFPHGNSHSTHTRYSPDGHCTEHKILLDQRTERCEYFFTVHLNEERWTSNGQVCVVKNFRYDSCGRVESIDDGLQNTVYEKWFHDLDSPQGSLSLRCEFLLNHKASDLVTYYDVGTSMISAPKATIAVSVYSSGSSLSIQKIFADSYSLQSCAFFNYDKANRITDERFYIVNKPVPFSLESFRPLSDLRDDTSAELMIQSSFTYGPYQSTKLVKTGGSSVRHQIFSNALGDPELEIESTPTDLVKIHHCYSYDRYDNWLSHTIRTERNGEIELAEESERTFYYF